MLRIAHRVRAPTRPPQHGKPFLDNTGLFADIARGWSVTGTFEYQPGALLTWNQNIFFNGNLG